MIRVRSKQNIEEMDIQPPILSEERSTVLMQMLDLHPYSATGSEHGDCDGGGVEGRAAQQDVERFSSFLSPKAYNNNSPSGAVGQSDSSQHGSKGMFRRGKELNQSMEAVIGRCMRQVYGRVHVRVHVRNQRDILATAWARLGSISPWTLRLACACEKKVGDSAYA